MIEEDDDWRDALSPGARELVDRIDLRWHGVDLERVQRIHLDIDNEPMEFTAATVAQMIQDIADQCDEHEAFVLHAVVRALRGEDGHHVLQLKHRKRGKFVSPTEHEAHHARTMSWLHTLAHHERRGMKTEAAVALISAHWRVSRAAVFKGVREAEEFLRSGAEMFPGNSNFANPRPDKSRNN